MAKFTETQEVKKFKDKVRLCTQEVHLDSEDLNGCMIVNHDGYEISLSVDNWNSLVELANSVLIKAYPKKEVLANDLQS